VPDLLRFDAAIALRLVDAMIGVMLVEALAMALWQRALAASLVWSLLAGAALAAALRCALMQSGLAALVACLCGAGLCHGLDLRQRWRRYREEMRRPTQPASRIGGSVGP
jgi:hypothetical protein